MTRLSLLLLLLVAGCASAPQHPVTIESPDPLILTDLAGEHHDLDAALARGESVALVFWQTWCSACRREAPALVRAARQHGERIRFLGVVPGRDAVVDDDEVERVSEEWGYSFPQVRDRDLSLSRLLKIQGTPTVAILGAGRQVRYHDHRAPKDWAEFHGAGSKDRVAPLPGDSTKPAQVHRERRLGVMGTDLVIEALGPDPDLLDKALDAAVAEIRRVEDVFTDWRPSELMQINESAGQGPCQVSAEQAGLIGKALELCELTGGAFDITFAGVGRLWDFKADPPRVPSRDEIEAALQSVGYGRVKVDLEASTVTLPAGMRIGLGGIAKGYGVDRAMQVLMDHGVEHGVVNAGGDMKVLGRNQQGKLWDIAIKHPRKRETVLAVVPVSNVCVVTSGDYERFFEHEGRRYHHILDPRTGYPAEGCMSATVVAPDAAYADALATALCVLGPAEGLVLVDGLPRVEAILVDMSGKLHFSAGLKKKFARQQR